MPITTPPGLIQQLDPDTLRPSNRQTQSWVGTGPPTSMPQGDIAGMLYTPQPQALSGPQQQSMSVDYVPGYKGPAFNPTPTAAGTPYTDYQSSPMASGPGMQQGQGVTGLPGMSQQLMQGMQPQLPQFPYGQGQNSLMNQVAAAGPLFGSFGQLQGQAPPGLQGLLSGSYGNLYGLGY